MPIKSKHVRISFKEWERLPRPLGWKYEYFEGCAHTTPSHQCAVTTVSVTQRPVAASCEIRPVQLDDEVPLLDVYLEAFERDAVFCDYTAAQYLKAARADLKSSFSGRRAPLLQGSYVAVEPAGPMLVGAALFSRDAGCGPVLDLLFVRTAWRRRGLATALVASGMNALDEAGEERLTSCYYLANLPSQAWHRAFGFVERPDLWYAQAHQRHAYHELSRRGEDLTASERAKLQSELQHWKQQVQSLELLAEKEGFNSVHPRLPHSKV